MQLGLKSLALFLLTAPLAGGMAYAQDQKAGLWHAYGEKDKGTFFFLVYKGEQSKVYGPDWKRVETSLLIEGDSLSFQVPQGHYKHQVKVSFEEGALVGTYERPHPQFPWKGEVKSHRISSDPDWDPWAFLSEAQVSVINPWADVLKEAPKEDAAAFRKYWTETIEPRYYALFTHSLYANSLAFFLPEIRDEAIQGLYRIVTQEGEEIEPLLKGFKGSVSEVFADLKEQYSWMRIPGIVIPMLHKASYDFTLRVINVESHNNRPFLLFNLEWMAENLSPVQRRYLLAQGLLAFEHESKHAIANFLRNAVARRGIAAYLASKLDYSDSPADYLFQPEEASEEELAAAFQKFKSHLGRRFTMRLNQAGSNPFENEYRAAAYLFAYGFASKMAERFSDEQLAHQFDYDRLREEMIAYGRALKGRPDTARPKADAAPEGEGKEEGEKTSGN